MIMASTKELNATYKPVSGKIPDLAKAVAKARALLNKKKGVLYIVGHKADISYVYVGRVKNSIPGGSRLGRIDSSVSFFKGYQNFNSHFPSILYPK
jgi:hypothetical protein